VASPGRAGARAPLSSRAQGTFPEHWRSREIHGSGRSPNDAPYNRCVERARVLRCRTSVKALAATAVVALTLCASAVAKFQISVAACDTTPAVGQPVTIVVRSERKLDYNLRLIAVAPGRNIFRVVATITGDTSRPDIARNGFEVPLVRIGPNRWRGTARFRSIGRWRVVVPNGAPVGVVIPAGVARLTLAVH
jgi:hypothetical protein